MRAAGTGRWRIGVECEENGVIIGQGATELWVKKTTHTRPKKKAM